MGESSERKGKGQKIPETTPHRGLSAGRKWGGKASMVSTNKETKTEVSGWSAWQFFRFPVKEKIRYSQWGGYEHKKISDWILLIDSFFLLEEDECVCVCLCLSGAFMFTEPSSLCDCSSCLRVYSLFCLLVQVDFYGIMFSTMARGFGARYEV